MLDVAAKAGVSQATVSLVLNENRGVRLSVATRTRVLDAARELGYELVKRGPRRTSSDKTVIGMLVDEVSTDPWMALAFDGVREKAWEYGLTVTLAVTGGDPRDGSTGSGNDVPAAAVGCGLRHDPHPPDGAREAAVRPTDRPAELLRRRATPAVDRAG